MLKKSARGMLILFTFISTLAFSQILPPIESLTEQPALPDPFKMLDGTPIKTKKDWYEKRRPELKILFQHYIYGYLPPKPETKAFLLRQDEQLFNGKATYKEIRLDLLLPEGKTYSINLALFLPNKASGPVPVFVAVNKCGNHTLLGYEGITIIERSWQPPDCAKGYPQRGTSADAWAVENTISRGYALATYCVEDMDPDRHDWTDGIHAKYPSAPGDEDTKWGTIAAWAWGLLRVVDYLETDAAIDTSRICATGWSRNGKTALFAAAMDERIDLVIPHQSGTGGMALSRMNPSESVAKINESFPHWFNDNFAKFGQDVERLPVDQHLLVALVAPRPVLDVAGLQDTWASPHLALETLKAASPVYEFLGVKGVVGQGYVKDEIGNTETGRLLQYQRDTKHTLNIDYWNAMMDFADRQFASVKKQ